MDKEAQERIEKILDQYAVAFEVHGQYSPTPWAKEIVELLPELGYRKLLKDKPPLLSDEKAYKAVEPHRAIIGAGAHDVWKSEWAIAQAQREADIKWYGG